MSVRVLALNINTYRTAMGSVDGILNNLTSLMASAVEEFAKQDQELQADMEALNNELAAGALPEEMVPEAPVEAAVPIEGLTTPDVNTIAVEPSVDVQPQVLTPGIGANNDQTCALLGLTPQQLDVVKATIRHEAGNNPQEMLNVASAVRNRMITGAWGGGSNPYGIITAKGQFSSYLGGHYKQYTNGNYYQGDANTLAAVNEQINGILLGTIPTTHNYQSFRGKGSPDGVQLVAGGNKYRGSIC